MADLIQFSTVSHNHLFISKSEQWGGHQWQINLNTDTSNLLDWLKTYKDALDAEQKAREQFPAVKEAYEHYRTVLGVAQGAVK